MQSKLTGPELIQLKNAVVEDFDVSNWRELGALTNIIDEVENHPRLIRSLNWGDPDYDGLALVFLRKMIGPNDENLGVVNNYIQDKCKNSGEDISSEKTIGRKIVFSPNIFSIPEEQLDSQLVSVMMPFSPSFNAVHSAISNASVMAGFACKRVDDIWNHSTVIQDVFSLIFQSFIVVCDFSGKNPNVFYEAGIAHTLGKHVVPITQSEQDIPFDLQHHRYAKYLNNGEGLETLKQELYSRFVTLDGMRR
ncbi:MAG: hypothetical protein PF503_18275 [Desulfobacula sp.]|nr:hypothetical protein [Desulfobacula sp.]